MRHRPSALIPVRVLVYGTQLLGIQLFLRFLQVTHFMSRLTAVVLYIVSASASVQFWSPGLGPLCVPFRFRRSPTNSSAQSDPSVPRTLGAFLRILGTPVQELPVARLPHLSQCCLWNSLLTVCPSVATDVKRCVDSDGPYSFSQTSDILDTVHLQPSSYPKLFSARPGDAFLLGAAGHCISLFCYSRNLFLIADDAYDSQAVISRASLQYALRFLTHRHSCVQIFSLRSGRSPSPPRGSIFTHMVGAGPLWPLRQCTPEDSAQVWCPISDLHIRNAWHLRRGPPPPPPSRARTHVSFNRQLETGPRPAMGPVERGWVQNNRARFQPAYQSIGPATTAPSAKTVKRRARDEAWRAHYAAMAASAPDPTPSPSLPADDDFDLFSSPAPYSSVYTGPQSRQPSASPAPTSDNHSPEPYMYPVPP